MPCIPVVGPKGARGWVCVRGPQPRPKCHLCGRPGGLLCDYPAGPGKTCDRPLCRRCALHLDRDTDWCPSHALEGFPPAQQPAPEPAPELPAPAAPEVRQLGLFGGAP